MAREQCAVKRPDTGECAIHIALRKKDFDMLRLVIELGGNINSQNVKTYVIVPFMSISEMHKSLDEISTSHLGFCLYELINDIIIFVITE